MKVPYQKVLPLRLFHLRQTGELELELKYEPVTIFKSMAYENVISQHGSGVSGPVSFPALRPVGM